MIALDLVEIDRDLYDEFLKGINEVINQQLTWSHQLIHMYFLIDMREN